MKPRWWSHLRVERDVEGTIIVPKELIIKWRIYYSLAQEGAPFGSVIPLP